MKHRLTRITTFLVGCMGFAIPALAQRLPDAVIPSHYKLTFTPDLASATFAGEEEIAVRVARQTTTVVLNALELAISEATVVQGAASMRARVAYEKDKQQATLSLERPLVPGDARIVTRFTGSLNDQLGGFYLSKTAKRRYAVDAVRSHRRPARVPVLRRAGVQGDVRHHARSSTAATSRSPTARVSRHARSRRSASTR